MRRLILTFVIVCFSASMVVADVASANKYIAEAKNLNEKNYSEALEEARKKLDLAELELEGVLAEAKKPIVEVIATMRKELDAKKTAANLKQFQRDLERIMREAESAAGNLAIWPAAQSRFDEFARKPEVAAALGIDLQEAR